jgi:HK97 family phage portal protein
MVVISADGTVRALSVPAAPATGPTSIAPRATWQQPQSYLRFYTSQPNIRTCVEFLARNIAQLGIHVFRRLDGDDRERLIDHGLALSLDAPNPGYTRYRMIEDLVTDMGIYFNAYWVKLRATLPDRLGLLRLPPYEMTVHGAVLPTAFEWTSSITGASVTFAPDDIVHFRGYGGMDAPFMGISPLETLRGILLEEREATSYRAGYWANAARIEGVLTRLKDTPAGKWSNDQVAEYARQWKANYTGRSGGGTPILPVGMEWKANAFSARDSEYIQGGKLRREICAAAYHIPLPLVGILEHATFSNIKEQHKQLFTDCLGPWLQLFQGEFHRQILPEFRDTDRVYSEFNIAEKLKGDFEEQAAAYQTLIGCPVMTVNEGRGRLNLPRQDDPAYDEVMRPLNMTTPSGDQASADDVPQAAIATVRAHWDRQAARLAKVPTADRAQVFDQPRYDRELTTDLIPIYRALGHDDAAAARLSMTVAHQLNTHVKALLVAGHPVFNGSHP